MLFKSVRPVELSRQCPRVGFQLGLIPLNPIGAETRSFSSASKLKARRKSPCSAGGFVASLNQDSSSLCQGFIPFGQHAVLAFAEKSSS